MTNTLEQQQMLNCLHAWLRIRFEDEDDWPASVEEFREAVEHSALLPRLLSGKTPLTAPPPLSHGQPWYELGEQGFATCEVVCAAGELCINGGHWQIVDDCADREDEYLVRSPGQPGTYLVWKVPSLSIDADAGRCWMIERDWSR